MYKSTRQKEKRKTSEYKETKIMVWVTIVEIHSVSKTHLYNPQ